MQGGKPGDLIFRVTIEVPRRLNREQKELLRQFDGSTSETNYQKRKGFFDKIKDMFN